MDDNASEKFGVKSYLHYFYEDCGIGLCEIEQTSQQELSIKRRNRKWAACIVLCVIGFLVASAGFVLLIFGVLDSPVDAKAFVGGAMLCVGGITVAICFTLINMEILKRKQEVLEQKHFQERCKQGLTLYRDRADSKQHSSPPDSLPSTPSSPHSHANLPVSLYQVSTVQPLLDEPTVEKRILSHKSSNSSFFSDH